MSSNSTNRPSTTGGGPTPDPVAVPLNPEAADRAGKIPEPTMLYDGNPTNLNRFLAHVAAVVIVNRGAFITDGLKNAYMVTCFEGAALDWWVSLYTEEPTVLDVQPHAAFVERLKQRFGFGQKPAELIAETQLARLKQSGDFMEFLAKFEGLCDETNLGDDLRRMLLQEKITGRLKQALSDSGDPLSRYSKLRDFLITVYARQLGSNQPAHRVKCGNCGKRGHNATQCRSPKDKGASGSGK